MSAGSAVATGAGAGAGPLQRVLAAVAGGGGLDDVARRAGVSRDEAGAMVDALVGLGRLSAQALSPGCPPGGCGDCRSGGQASGGPGSLCEPPRASGPVLVVIGPTRPGR